MEQKKLLIVLVSVGVFLVIVLGVGIVMFKPLPKPVSAGPVAAAPGPSAQAPASADPAEWVRNPKAMPGLQTPPAAGSSSSRGDVIIIYGERPNAGAPVSAAPVPTASAPAAADDGSLKVDVAVPSVQNVPPVSAPPVTGETAKPAAAERKSTAPAETQTKTQSAKKPAPAKKPATPSAAAAKSKGEEFWIQTGSFAAKARAESAKETLGAKGIASLVETKEISGKTYFRVRVGPYSSKNEADYWLSLVKTIDGFNGSYVSQLKAKR